MSASPVRMCPIQPLPETGQETGIDLGIEAFATLSDGTRIFHPGWYRKAERALKTAQRRVSRRKKGSNRRRKAVHLLAKAHQKVRRQRQDFHHKTALALVRANDTIYHEDLQTANMLKNHHLAKSISDAGWAAFLSILAFKAACAGKRAHSGQPCIHEPDLFWLWRSGPQRLVRPLAFLPGLRHQPAPRPQRRQEYRGAGQSPSGRGWVTGLGEPRIRGAVGPAECQRGYTACGFPVSHTMMSWSCPATLRAQKRGREPCTFSNFSMNCMAAPPI